jgi:glycosyltransferase involved in cell wall biosynthesis
MPAVRAAAQEHGVTENVDLRGYVPNTDVIDLERELRPSCLINLSASEGLPVSMMEAASLGIPIVGTDVGGVCEIIANRTSGHLLDADFTDNQAADALEWLAGLPEQQYEDVCGASRRIWQTDFDQAVVYPRFCSEVLGAD